MPWRPALCFLLNTLCARDFYEQAPIHYSDTQATDPVASMVKAFENGTLNLDTSTEKAMLLDVLKRLKVPVTSQVLVYSRTSLQRDLISPATPRALYFSDSIYVGWVPGGSIEIVSMDKKLGPIFYILDKHPSFKETGYRIYRDQNCLDCHGTSRTAGFPGLMVRSVFPDQRGFPILSAGTYMTDHTSPITQRWGGWYVTGEIDGPEHMGNKLFESKDDGGAELTKDHGVTLKKSRRSI